MATGICRRPAGCASRRGSNAASFCLALLPLLLQAATAALPPADSYLPDDTLAFVTIPSFERFQGQVKNVPQVRCWLDPAMRPFRERFLAKWNEEFVRPLERELGVGFAEYAGLFNGQITMAVVPGGRQRKKELSPSWLLLLDTKNQGDRVKEKLAELRKNWSNAGRALRTETIRGVEFVRVRFGTNDVPETWRKFFPPVAQLQELGAEPESERPPPERELVLGQFETAVVAGTSVEAVEKVMVRLTGGSSMTLSEAAAYQTTRLASFGEASLYAWAYNKPFIEDYLRRTARKQTNPEAPNPFDLKPERVVLASGLPSLKAAALSLRDSSEGLRVEVFLAVPETSRQGIFTLLAGTAGECGPPRFVPADVVEFRRWRMDGGKAWATMEKMLKDYSPAALGGLNFLLESADKPTKEKNPGFDLKKRLVESLGGDVIFYEKTPRSRTPEGIQNPPFLLLIGSPDQETLLVAVKGLVAIFPNSEQLAEREFLGRRIWSVPMPLLEVTLSSSGRTENRTLYFAASGGYLALATDASLLEEYLRASENPPRPLSEVGGLAMAAQKVLAPNASLFGYEDQAEGMRFFFETARDNPGGILPYGNTSAAFTFLTTAWLGARPSERFGQWAEWSLLPDYDRVSKYFSFLVYSSRSSQEGITLKLFLPTPPALEGTRLTAP